MPKVKLFNEDEVLEKAMELFWKKGYHATSIQDLVTHLGLSRSSIYDTYGGKKELFNKSFLLYRTSNYNGLKVFFESQPTVVEGFKKMFTLAIQESQTDSDNKGCFVVNTTTELIPGDDDLVRVLDKNKADFEAFFYTALLSGEQSGEIPKGKDLKAIASLLFILYGGIRVVAKLTPNTKNLMASVEPVLSLLR
jgi:TetR/AcrR family transcriptional regulator, transcriptional repressor for nem operon